MTKTKKKCVVTVEPNVVAGLDKGGEDLYLEFTTEVLGGKVPTEFDLVLNVCNDVEGYNVETLDGAAYEAWFENDVPYTAKVRYWTCHYEHEWAGDAADARKLVEEEFANPKNWSFCHKPGEKPHLRFNFTHFVDGNAD